MKPEPKLEPPTRADFDSALMAIGVLRRSTVPVWRRAAQIATAVLIRARDTRTPASEPTEAQVEAAAQAMYTSWAHRTYGKSSVDDPRWEKQWPQQDAKTRAMWCADARAALKAALVPDVRRQALEEAANVAEAFCRAWLSSAKTAEKRIGAAIRALAQPAEETKP